MTNPTFTPESADLSAHGGIACETISKHGAGCNSCLRQSSSQLEPAAKGRSSCGAKGLEVVMGFPALNRVI